MEPVSAVERAVRLDRRIILGCLALIAALAWAYLVMLAERMSDADMSLMGMASAGAMMMPQPWTAMTAVLMLAMWWIMMLGMMLPSAAPMILLFGRIQRTQLAAEAPYARTAIFTAAYLLVWGVFSAFATSAQWALGEAAWFEQMSMTVGRDVGAVLLVLGGLYQLTPFKRACLDHCRSPAEFLARHWRKGGLGAWRLGLVHGAYCLGCCWLLMLLLFVFGVMNLAWIAALAVLVLLEKLVPHGDAVARAAGVLMLGAGLVLGAAAWL
jgi:predicted metal-binding membrane protein